MSQHDPSLHDALTDLTHELQAARSLARTLRIDLEDQSRTALAVETALDRAAGALVQARENGGRP